MTDEQIKAWYDEASSTKIDWANSLAISPQAVSQLRRFASLARADVEQERDALQARVAEFRMLLNRCRGELLHASEHLEPRRRRHETVEAINAALDHKETP